MNQLHTVRLMLVAAAVLVSYGCDSQDPAFTEHRTEHTLEGSDQKVTAAGSSLPPEGDNGGTADLGGAPGEADTQNVDSSGLPGGGVDGGGTGVDAGGTDAGGTTAGGTTAGGADSGGGGVDAGGGPGGEGGFNLPMRTVNTRQSAPGKVDILWIVDSSGSMEEEQNYLSTNFNAMINQLVNAGHDFQTAITTADICQDTMPSNLAQRVCPANEPDVPLSMHKRGEFVGEVGRRVLKRGDPDLVTRFNSYTKQGINGSTFEHGLKAAELAISKSLTGENEPLVREDAFLAVIVVSDEEDDGIGLGMEDAYHHHNFVAEGHTTFRYTDDDFISYVRAMKGPGKFSLSAITGTRLPTGKMCSAKHSQPLEEGTQYIKAAQKTGGILQSICETNWSQSLAQIGMDLSAQSTQIVLPSTPDVATIKVYVNGTPTSAWTYNSGNNAVKWNAGSIPAIGAAIKITYYDD